MFSQTNIGIVEGNVGESTERQGGARVDLSERYDFIFGRIWNWKLVCA